MTADYRLKANDTSLTIEQQQHRLDRQLSVVTIAAANGNPGDLEQSLGVTWQLPWGRGGVGQRALRANAASLRLMENSRENGSLQCQVSHNRDDEALETQTRDTPERCPLVTGAGAHAEAGAAGSPRVRLGDAAAAPAVRAARGAGHLPCCIAMLPNGARSSLSVFQGDSSDKLQHLQRRKRRQRDQRRNDCIINNVSNS